MPKRLLHFHHPVWVAIAVVLVLFAGLLTTARALWPDVSEYGEEVELWLGEELGNPVKIGSLDGSWNGTSPVLSLYNIQVYAPDGDVVIASLPQVVIELGWIDLIKARGFALQAMDISIEHLGVLREKSGRIALDEFSLRSVDSDDRKNSLPNIAKLRIHVQTVQFRDEQQPDIAPIEFGDVVVRFQKREDGYAFSFDAGPSQFAQSLQIRIFFDEDFLQDKVRTGRAFVLVDDLAIQPWASYFSSAGISVKEGVVDGQVWLHLAAGRIERIAGEISARSLGRVQIGADKLFALKPIASGFQWVRNKSGWQLDLDGLLVQHPQGLAVSTSRMSVAVGYSDEQPKRLSEVDVQASIMDTGALWELMALFPEMAVKVEEVSPVTKISGLVHNLRIHWHNEFDRDDTFEMDAQLDGLSVDGDYQVTGLTGRLITNQQRGQLQLDSPVLSLFLRNAFEAPFPDMALNGTIAWLQKQSDWQLRISDLSISTAHFDGHVRADFDHSEDGSDIDAQMDFSGLPVANLGDYLPVKAMSPTLVAWLKRSLVKGVISTGSLLLKGDPADYPFEQGGGSFQALLDLNDVTLNYGEGWPAVEGLDVGLEFVGKRMNIYARNGHIFDADITGTVATIDDLLSDSLLVLHGKTVGSFAGGLTFLAKSPLSDRFGPYLDGTGASGHHRLDFQMDYPLHAKKGFNLDGTLDFVDAGLVLEDFGITLSKTNGPLNIREDGVSGVDISSEVFGQPAVLSAETRPQGGGSETVITLSAHLSTQDLAPFIPVQVQRQISGSTEWRADVHLPDASRVATQPVVLTMVSDLVGVKSDAPYPLNKDANAKWPMRLRGEFRTGRLRKGHINVNKKLDANVGFERDKHGRSVPVRGEVRLGGGRASKSFKNELALTGRLDHLDADAWIDLDWSDPQRISTQNEFPIDVVDLDVARLKVAGGDFSSAEIDLARKGHYMHGLFQSREAAGQVKISLSDNRDDVSVLDLEYLTIISTDSKDDSDELSPLNFKALKLNSDNFNLNGINLGELELETRPIPTGLVIDIFSFNADGFRVDGSGTWLEQNGRQHTQMKMDFESDAFGKTLEQFDFQGNLEEAPATAEIDLNWAGSPASVELEKLNGKLDLEIKKGRVLDIEPGVGRAFGLLSLGTLGRRLALDFSDLFKKGLSFDTVSGRFRFEQGQAYTDGLVMDGPAVHMVVSGRTGIVTQDYDQVAVVTPKVSASIPVAGALAGGPAVGAALYVVQKLVGSSIDKVAERRYRIEGTWAEPEISRLKTEVEAVAE